MPQVRILPGAPTQPPTIPKRAGERRLPPKRAARDFPRSAMQSPRSFPLVPRHSREGGNPETRPQPAIWQPSRNRKRQIPSPLPIPPSFPRKGKSRDAPPTRHLAAKPESQARIPFTLPVPPSFPRKGKSRDARPNPPSVSQAGIPSGKSLLPCPSPVIPAKAGIQSRPAKIAIRNQS